MEREIWVGIDWGNEEHQFCVLDEKRKVVLEDRVKHSAEGLRALVAKVLAFGAADEIAVAIEHLHRRVGLERTGKYPPCDDAPEIGIRLQQRAEHAASSGG